MALPDTRFAGKKKTLKDGDLDELARMRAKNGPAAPQRQRTDDDADAKPTDEARAAYKPPKTREEQIRAAKDAAREASRAKGSMAQPSEASDLDDVATQRMAASDEIDASNAQATQEQRARSGLMGGGLSGASSAMEGDLARQQGRGKVLAMQDFDRQAEDDDFTDIQRAAAIADLEDAYEADINGDGVIGGFNRGMFGGEDGVVGGTPMQGANETGADYGARVIGNKQKQNAGQYKDAIERSSPGDNGRAVAADEQWVYYKDFDTGVVFKVSKANNK